jgi:hypothetical protein
MSRNPNLTTELIRLLNEFSLRFEENSSDFSIHRISDLITDSEFYASKIETLAKELKLEHIPISLGRNIDLESNKDARYVKMQDPKTGQLQVVLYLLLENPTTTEFLQKLLTEAQKQIENTVNRWVKFLEKRKRGQ